MSNYNLRLIEDIYDTIAKPDTWNDVLETFVAEFNFLGANIFCSDEINSELTTAWLSPLISRLFPEYFDGGYYDIETKVFPVIPQVATEQNFIDEQFLLKKMLRETGSTVPEMKSVHDWLNENWGIRHRMSAALNINPSYWSFITIHLGNNTSFSEIGSEADYLLPHIAKAIQINRPFTLLKQRFNAVLDVLDKFKLGVFILNRHNEPIIKNISAQRILDDKDGIFVNAQGKIKMRTKDDIDIVSKSIEDLQSSSQNVQGHVIKRNSSSLPYYVEFSNINLSSEGEVGKYFLLVTIDPEWSEIVDLSGIEKVFGLSNSETSVAELLVEGKSNNEIAESRNVSAETIKTQVKAIMDKTDCVNRMALIKLAHRINIPVGR